MKMEYMLIPQQGDREIIVETIENLRKLSNQEIVDKYNRQFELGIVGSRQQALEIFSIGRIFMERFNATPVYLEGRVILGMKAKIRLTGEKFIYISNGDISDQITNDNPSLN